MSEEIINPESLLEETSFSEPQKRGRAYDADQVDSYMEVRYNNFMGSNVYASKIPTPVWKLIRG